MVESLKNAGSYILGVGGFILLLVFGAAILSGSVWLGEFALPTLISFSWIIFYINLLLFLPLALFRKTTSFATSAMFISSYVFGLTLWFLGLIFTYYIWGFLGILIGLGLFGVGVVFTGILSTLFAGEMASCIVLIVLLVVTYGLRVLAVYLSTRHNESGVGSY